MLICLFSTGRVGGRIQTYRDLANGWQAELGAMRIPKQHRFALTSAKRHNLTLAKFNNDPFRYNIHEKNLPKKPDFNALKFFLDEFNVHPKDRHQTASIYANFYFTLHCIATGPYKKFLIILDRSSLVNNTY